MTFALLLASYAHAWLGLATPSRSIFSQALSTASDITISDENRLQSLWGQDPFQTATRIVNGSISGTRMFLRRKEGLVVSYDDTFFAPLFHRNCSVASSSNQIQMVKKKKNFALTVAYLGTEFCGWQTQVNNTLPSVQQSLEEHLAILEGSRVDVRVCGRTDAGVHAIGQVCRYRTLKYNTTEKNILDHMNTFPMISSFKCLKVQQVSHKFHPSFGATCRAYVYVIDGGFISASEVQRLSDMLQELENKTLDYFSFSYGKVVTQSTECTLSCARSFCDDDGNVCIQLIGDRFLRRMVRILCSTALLQVFEKKTSLIPLLESKNRTVCAPPAPPHGLIFIGADFAQM